MKLLLKLLSEEVVITLIQVVLSVTLFESRNNQTGISFYVEQSLGISLSFYAFLAIGFACYTAFRLWQSPALLKPLEFAFVSIPFMLYLGAISAFIMEQHRSISGLLALALFYAYFLGRVIVRSIEERSRG